MRLSNRNAYYMIFMSAAILLLMTACSSYRICGFSGGDISFSAVSGRRFQIADIRISFTSTVKDDRFVFTSAARAPREKLIEKIHAARPDVFSCTDDAEKINVNLVMKSGRVEGQASILLYIFSLCTLPVWEDYISEGVAAVSLVEQHGQEGNVAGSPLKFESSQKFTFYSPIGLIPYGDRLDAVATCKRTFAYTQNAEDLNGVFAQTAADAIAKAVASLCERKSQHTQVTRNAPKVEKKIEVEKILPEESERDIEKVGDGPLKCSICGAVKDGNGKCPLCD